MDSRTSLLRTLIRVILIAALASTPVFLFAEGFGEEALVKVGLSNGVCVVFCLGLLALLRQGHAQLCARVFVFGLGVIVGVLAWVNGEGVHVNVVNFVLVTTLAAALLELRWLFLVAVAASAIMTGIGWKEAVPSGDESLLTARLETVVQFLPTYWVIVAVLAFGFGRRSGTGVGG